MELYPTPMRRGQPFKNGWFREYRPTTQHVLRTCVQLTLDERGCGAFSGHVSATSSSFLPHDIG